MVTHSDDGLIRPACDLDVIGKIPRARAHNMQDAYPVGDPISFRCSMELEMDFDHSSLPSLPCLP